MKKEIFANSSSFSTFSSVPLVADDVNAYEIVYVANEDLSGTTFEITAIRADGQRIVDSGEIFENTARYTLKNNMHAVVGDLKVRLAILDASGSCLTTKEVIFEVIEGNGPADISADTSYPILTSLILDMRKYVEISDKTLSDLKKEIDEIHNYATEQSRESLLKSVAFMEKYTDYTWFGTAGTYEGPHMRLVVEDTFFKTKLNVSSPADLKLSDYTLLIKRKDTGQYFTARILGYENRSDGNFTLRYEQNEYGISSGMEGAEYFNLVDEVYFCLMSEDAEKALKKYLDSRVEETLKNANSHTDSALDKAIYSTGKVLSTVEYPDRTVEVTVPDDAISIKTITVEHQYDVPPMSDAIINFYSESGSLIYSDNIRLNGPLNFVMDVNDNADNPIKRISISNLDSVFAVTAMEYYKTGKVEKYKDYTDTAIENAKGYTDDALNAAEQNAQIYADNAEKNAKAYADNKSAAVERSTKFYADEKDTANLKEAKSYTDEQLSGLKDDIYAKSYTTKDITGAKLGTGSDDYYHLTLVDNNGIDRISINYNGWEDVYLYLEDSDGNTLYEYYLNAPESFDSINKVLYPKVEGINVAKIYIPYSDQFGVESIDYTYYDEPIITDELAHEKYTDNALNTAKAYTDEKIAEILKLLGNA